MHQEYIDNTKHQDCVRLLSVNLRGFSLDDEEKVKMMIKAAIKYSIDRILFSSLDRKWTLNKIERLK